MNSNTLNPKLPSNLFVLLLRLCLWRKPSATIPLLIKPVKTIHKKLIDEHGFVTINLQYIGDHPLESLSHYQQYEVWYKTNNLVVNPTKTQINSNPVINYLWLATNFFFVKFIFFLYSQSIFPASSRW